MKPLGRSNRAYRASLDVSYMDAHTGSYVCAKRGRAVPAALLLSEEERIIVPRHAGQDDLVAVPVEGQYQRSEQALLADDLCFAEIDCVDAGFEITDYRAVAMTIICIRSEEEDVGTRAAQDMIERTFTGCDHVVAAPTVDPITAAATTQHVVAHAPYDPVEPRAPYDHVVTAATVEVQRTLGALPCGEQVVAFGSDIAARRLLLLVIGRELPDIEIERRRPALGEKLDAEASRIWEDLVGNRAQAVIGEEFDRSRIDEDMELDVRGSSQ
ncbi:hypothetical protein ABIA14_004884 [Sinorhizobium fredii]|nr:hypothetical protein [Sinorhizobium fredii]